MNKNQGDEESVPAKDRNTAGESSTEGQNSAKGYFLLFSFLTEKSVSLYQKITIWKGVPQQNNAALKVCIYCIALNKLL